MRSIQFIATCALFAAASADFFTNLMSTIANTNSTLTNSLLNLKDALAYSADAPKPWTGPANCQEPVAFYRYPEIIGVPYNENNTDLRYQYKLNGPAYTPLVGAQTVLAQGNFFDNKTVHANIKIVPSSPGAYEVTCEYITGQLITPKWIPRVNNTVLAYAKLVSIAPTVFASGGEALATYYSGPTCTGLSTQLDFTYDTATRPRTFDRYVNDARVNITMNGTSFGEMDAFMAGSPSNPDKGRFAVVAVFMNRAKQENCQLSAAVSLNSDVYSASLAKYITKYFPNSKTEAELQTLITQCVASAQACNA